MMKKDWITAALSNDVVVAELLIRIKHQQTSTSTKLLPFFTWGYRKSRSKPQLSSSAVDAAGVGCFKKEQQSGSPTTPLCWSSGGGFGGTSTSDCCDESSRPSDLSSGAYRSNKSGALGNEGATTSSYNKSRKRKSYAELKEEEDFLLKERLHLNKELDSMRVTMCNQIATSRNLKKYKIDLHQNSSKEAEKMVKTIIHQAQTSCAMEREIKTPERGFVLPDLNMTPSEEEV
uniref:uncharacterized protein LOC122579031 n=1 Tax=Erigeron canadensis TaxID=72917 RepID=UPI001CB8B699|nr:uncharacterized protein LOC122579031 [Erigeron canadensis]